MKRLSFRYNMVIQFDISVKDHHFTLKCLPGNDTGQKVEEIQYTVYPNHFISRSVDSFQNDCIYGFCSEEHDHFQVDVQGIIQTECERKRPANGGEAIFRYQTPHTKPGDAIREYYLKLTDGFRAFTERDGQKDVLTRTLYYMHKLHENFSYESGSTQITTTAEEAFAAGKGVCQDYAHILLSLLRMDKIPCRYVTGMMIGEGFSHAWVEVLTKDGWVGVDPTHDQITGEGYIYIAMGRDYKDCLLNQGVFVGCGRQAIQAQTIKAEVWEIGE